MDSSGIDAGSETGVTISSSSTASEETVFKVPSKTNDGDNNDVLEAEAMEENIAKLSSSAVDQSELAEGGDNGVTFAFAQPLLPPPPPPKFSASSGVSSSCSAASSPVKKDTTPVSLSPQQLQEKAEKRAREKEEKYQQILSSLDYHPPKYGAPCADTRYNFEVLKNGTIVDSVKFSSFDRKGYYIVGRVPGCDVVAENPTVSRMHAILQFIQCPKADTKVGEDVTDSPQETGLYLYDLKSTHGTFLNKNQLFPHKFYRVHVGHVLKFGSSQRMYIVNGPDEDSEVESDKTVTELLNERLQKDLERKRLEEEYQMKRNSLGSKLPSDNIEEEGITWGMREDADEESDMRINPFAIDYEASELTLDNPKKSLRSWFEREGQDLEYEMREKSTGQYVCRIALPLDGPTDSSVYAESEVKGKKKEAALDAAIKACKILDSHGLLRTSNQESRKRKEKKWEDEDYYSSDEDTFLDRTGSIEKRREKRMRISGKSGDGSSDGVLTYDSLCAKDSELEKEIKDLQEQIEKSQQMKERADDGDVDIDDYLTLLKTGVFDLKKLKARLKTAQEESTKTKKLMQIAKPAELPAYLQVKAKPNQEPSVGEMGSSPPTCVVVTDQQEISIPTQVKEAESKAQRPPPLIGKKPMVGPRKPPLSLVTPPAPEPKRFGLITPSELSALKTSELKAPVVKKCTHENDQDDPDDAPFEEERDSSSSSAQEDDDDDDVNAANIPTEDNDLLSSSSVVPEFTKPGKKKRQRHRNKQKNKPNTGQSYQDDPAYSEWVPPVGQTGDGRTSLNEKLGY